MEDIFNLKKQIVVNPTSSGATITSQIINASGYESMTLDVMASTADVVSDGPSVLKLQECDTTVSSSFADVAAFVGGGASGFTLPAGVTATTTLVYFSFNVDLRQRKKYLRMLISPQTTQTYAAIANLGRCQTWPTSAVAQGCSNVVTG